MKKLIFSLVLTTDMLFTAAVPTAAESETRSFEKLNRYAVAVWRTRSGVRCRF